jgi:hypothetical protein
MGPEPVLLVGLAPLDTCGGKFVMMVYPVPSEFTRKIEPLL